MSRRNFLLAGACDVFMNLCMGLLILAMIVKYLLQNLTVDMAYSKFGFV